MGQQEALQKVFDKYGEDRVEYDPITRYATVEGVGRIYVGQKMTIRQQIVADLVTSGGMKTTEAVRLLNNKEAGEPVGSHYHQVLKNVDVSAYVEGRLAEIADRARTKLKNAVETAADNVVKAVNDGDYTASVKVLTGVGVLVNKSEKDIQVNVSFGSWLAAEQQDKTIQSFDQSPKAIEHEEAELVEEFDLESIEIEELELEPELEIAAPIVATEPEPEIEILTGAPDNEFPDTMPLIDLGDD